MDIILYVCLFAFSFIMLLVVYGSYRKKKEMLEMMYQEYPEMKTQFKCLKCGRKRTVNWCMGDYAMKEVDYPHYDAKRVKCDGKSIINGIYLEMPMSKEDKKYKELCDKWR